MQFDMSADVVHARVVAGGIHTPYDRVGRGDPVVLLTDSAERRAAILAAMPRWLLTVAPTELPAGADPSDESADFPAWLRSLLEALGLQGVALLAEAPLASAALGFATLEPERVSHVVLLRLASDGAATGHAATAVAELPPGTPLLEAGIGGSDAAAIERVLPHIVTIFRAAAY